MEFAPARPPGAHPPTAARPSDAARSSASGGGGKLKAVLFDLDGVLVWSVPMHWHAFRKTFEAEGRPFSLEEYMRVGVGASRDEVIRRVLGDVSPEVLRRLMSEKERHAREYVERHGLEAVPGAVEFVRAARARGLRTAVATASRTPEMMLSAIGALHLFDALVHRGHVKRSKPHPDLYLKAAEILDAPPRCCLVVEDSSVGVEAALAAGMAVIALTTTEKAETLGRATAVFEGFEGVDLGRWLHRTET